MHVTQTGILVDDEVRTHRLQLDHCITHRQDAAYGYATSCSDGCLIFEYLWETLYHATHDILMLLGTNSCQFACTFVNMGFYYFYTFLDVKT